MSSRSKIPWKFLLFISILAVGAAVTYDVQLHGTFKKSVTGRLLRDYGVLGVYNQAAVKTSYYYGQGSKWMAKHGPVYYEKVDKAVGPYVRIVWDKVQTGLLIVWEALGPVRAWTNKTLPPLLKTVNEQYVPKVTAIAKQTAASIQSNLIDLGLWLQNNVFTGNMSIENLQKIVGDLVAKGQAAAGQAVSWVNQQYAVLTK